MREYHFKKYDVNVHGVIKTGAYLFLGAIRMRSQPHTLGVQGVGSRGKSLVPASDHCALAL